MRTAWVAKLWERVRSSFWFVPAVMSLTAAAAAYVALALDRGAPGRWLSVRGLGYGGGAEGAALVLQTIAGSMMTVAGVVFSLTLIALSLASNQFGPRLLRNFMRDPVNQTVLGAFIATFLYCIGVLLAVRRGDDSFVPHFAVTFAVVLALASMTLLVYFIHHVSVSIQADELIARIGGEIRERIDVLFPEHVGEGSDAAEEAPPALPAGFERQARAVPALEDGYVQRVEADEIMALAGGRDLVIRLERRPGDYVVRGTALALAWPGERVDEAFERELNGCFALGNQRTPAQDVSFGVQQLVEIAVRALSPGVNDPFTAIASINRLSSALHRLAQRAVPSPCRLDGEGRLRVVARPTTFAGVVEQAFDALRQHSRSSALVTEHLLEALASLATAVRRPQDLAAIRAQVERVALGAEEHPDSARERELLRRRCGEILRSCDGG